MISFVEFNAEIHLTESSDCVHQKDSLFFNKNMPAFGIHNTFQENHILTGFFVYSKESIFAPHFSVPQFVYTEAKHSHTGRLDNLSQRRAVFLFRVRNFMSAKLIIRRL